MAKSRKGMKNGPQLRALDTFFRPQSAEIRDLPAIALSLETLVFIGIATCIFTAFDSEGILVEVGFAFMALVWFIACVLQVALYVSLLMLWGWAQGRISLPPLFLPIACLLAFLVNFEVTIWHIGLYSPDAAAVENTLPTFLKGAALALLFEALFLTYVLPMVQRPGADPALKERTIVVAGEHFKVGDILYLRSNEHYLEVVTSSSRHKLRARLGDVVSQFEETDGVLAHRSHWIARGAIREMVSRDGTDQIVTSTGERLTVARPRREQVQNWMAAHLDSAPSRAG